MSLLQETLRLLPQLSHADLVVVQAHIAALKQDDVSGEVDPLYLAFSNYKKKCGYATPPLGVLKRTKGFKRLKDAAVIVDVFMARLNLRQVQRFNLALFLGDLCIDFIKGRNLPINLNTYSWALTTIEERVEQAFPGYAECGMLSAIIEGRWMMAKIIGMVGSRRRDSREDLRLAENAFYHIYEQGDRLVSGGCPMGGDRFAYHIAKELGLTIITHYPGKGHSIQSFTVAAYARNTKIAEDCDVLIAVIAEDRKGGTEDTISKALKLGKPVLLVTANKFEWSRMR